MPAASVSEPFGAMEKITDLPSGEMEPSCAPSVPATSATAPPPAGTSASCVSSVPLESASTFAPSGVIASEASVVLPSLW